MFFDLHVVTMVTSGKGKRASIREGWGVVRGRCVGSAREGDQVMGSGVDM